LEKNIPDALGEIKTVSACMYTNTTDENFILDFLPDSKQQIILATGFSGHGFKFVPVIGEIITELVTEGKSKLPIDFLGINRFK
jgi:glycine/D-amino acid oxidase-like deaminating enzyme